MRGGREREREEKQQDQEVDGKVIALHLEQTVCLPVCLGKGGVLLQWTLALLSPLGKFSSLTECSLIQQWQNSWVQPHPRHIHAINSQSANCLCYVM